ncbi:MAG: hypothetical protein OHK0017_04900 [Patescibacteria group bacterium]
MPRNVQGDGGVGEFFDFLKTRQNKLEGVTITGGEPTLHTDLLDFITRIKDLGFKVKLDSNGSNPQTLNKILQTGLVDYVAMDIKSTPAKYSLLMGRPIDTERIKQSVQIIMNSGLDYEFRTTCVPGLHQPEDFNEIAQWLKGAKHYYLQEYQTNVNFDPDLKNRIFGLKLDLDEIMTRIQSNFLFISIRR